MSCCVGSVSRHSGVCSERHREGAVQGVPSSALLQRAQLHLIDAHSEDACAMGLSLKW